MKIISLYIGLTFSRISISWVWFSRICNTPKNIIKTNCEKNIFNSVKSFPNSVLSAFHFKQVLESIAYSNDHGEKMLCAYWFNKFIIKWRRNLFSDYLKSQYIHIEIQYIFFFHYKTLKWDHPLQRHCPPKRWMIEGRRCFVLNYTLNDFCKINSPRKVLDKSTGYFTGGMSNNNIQEYVILNMLLRLL